ncbi:kinase-like domain-containing protein [Glomus cerebriforme]|uniref:Kinase-like domain-containing protein n=1 Tax=Glomus cerebriforme TaxID=658196 RepID=A0A397TJK4_9GLOM|nr:kinase-like domain-containing protein [Glomus cerebriforme]
MLKSWGLKDMLESNNKKYHKGLFGFVSRNNWVDNDKAVRKFVNPHKNILRLHDPDGSTLNAYLNEYFKELNWNDKYWLALQLASAVRDGINTYENKEFGLKRSIPYINPISFDTKNSYRSDKKSDVYSIGVLLWQISSGRRPFHDESYNANLKLIIDGTPVEYSKLYTEYKKYERVGSNLNQLKSNDDNDCLKNFINKNQIKCYEYSDFKNISSIKRRRNVIRANLNDKNFALKFFNSDNATIDKVIYEVGLLRTVNHENILQFYGFTRIEDGTSRMFQMNPYMLVLEYADSDTLENYLNKNFNNLNWDDKLKLASQLSSAVLYLHDNNIMHRNFHANNILVHQKNIKLANFGLPSEVPK